MTKYCLVPQDLNSALYIVLKNEFLSKCIYVYTHTHTHIMIKDHVIFVTLRVHKFTPNLKGFFYYKGSKTLRIIIFNITNNSCHLLFSHEKVVPPKNVAHFKDLCSITKMF